MGQRLISDWLGAPSADAIVVRDEASISVARERTREEGARIGFTGERLEMLVAAVSELAQNQLRHVGAGVILVRPHPRGDVPGLEVIAADHGPGLADPSRALKGSFSTIPGSLGLGVSAVRRLTDEMDIDVRVRQGSCIRARKFAAPLARRREVGICGRPKEGERVSGDDAAFVRHEDRLFVAVADGLGHGKEASEAAVAIVNGARRMADLSFDDLIPALDKEAAATRGAALALVRLERSAEGSTALECAGVGNVSMTVQSADQTRHFGGISAIVGGSGQNKKQKPRIERGSLERGSALVLFTDGVSSRATLQDHRDVLHEHPAVIAQLVAATYGRTTDDCTVLVIR